MLPAVRRADVRRPWRSTVRSGCTSWCAQRRRARASVPGTPTSRGAPTYCPVCPTPRNSLWASTIVRTGASSAPDPRKKVHDVVFDEDRHQLRTGKRTTGHGHPAQHRDQPDPPRRAHQDRHCVTTPLPERQPPHRTPAHRMPTCRAGRIHGPPSSSSATSCAETKRILDASCMFILRR